MTLSFRQGNKELLFLGLGLPLWIYLLLFYLRLINRISVEREFVSIKNIVLGKRNIYFKDIEHWEENYTINLFAKFILMRVKGKKVVISNMSDSKNYKILRDSLATNCIVTSKKNDYK